jgi:hypothetical protein
MANSFARIGHECGKVLLDRSIRDHHIRFGMTSKDLLLARAERAEIHWFHVVQFSPPTGRKCKKTLATETASVGDDDVISLIHGSYGGYLFSNVGWHLSCFCIIRLFDVATGLVEKRLGATREASMVGAKGEFETRGTGPCFPGPAMLFRIRLPAMASRP